jgi:hypothetical protein
MDLQEQILKLSREETQLKIQLKDVKTKFNIHAKNEISETVLC